MRAEDRHSLFVIWRVGLDVGIEWTVPEEVWGLESARWKPESHGLSIEFAIRRLELA